MKTVPVKNRHALLDAVTKMVEANLLVLMPDERANFSGTHDDSGIGLRLVRSQKGAYKAMVQTPEGHTWVDCSAGSGGWKLWERLYDLACEQQEVLLAPRLTRLVTDATARGSGAVPLRDTRDVRDVRKA